RRPPTPPSEPKIGATSPPRTNRDKAAGPIPGVAVPRTNRKKDRFGKKFWFHLHSYGSETDWRPVVSRANRRPTPRHLPERTGRWGAWVDRVGVAPSPNEPKGMAGGPNDSIAREAEPQEASAGPQLARSTCLIRRLVSPRDQDERVVRAT